jgi:hypothetical protein
MATKNFDKLLNEFISQLTEAPVYAKPEEFVGNLRSGIEQAAGGGYGIGKLAAALNISKETAVDLIGQQIYDEVFPDGKNDANNDMAYRASIARAVKNVINIVGREKNIEIKGLGDAVAGYTARVIDQLTKADTQYGSQASPEEIKNVVSEPEEVEGSTPTKTETGETEEEPQDRTTVRIENMITDLVDDTGVLESDVLKDVERKIIASDGLGLEEGSIKGTVKALLSRLVRKQILERKGQYLKLGDNFEKYETSKDLGSEAISDEDIIQKVTGYGERKTRSRDLWGDE